MVTPNVEAFSHYLFLSFAGLIKSRFFTVLNYFEFVFQDVDIQRDYCQTKAVKFYN